MSNLISYITVDNLDVKDILITGHSYHPQEPGDLTDTHQRILFGSGTKGHPSGICIDPVGFVDRSTEIV